VIRINLLPVKQLKAEVIRRRELSFGACCLGITLLALGALYLYQSHQITLLDKELSDLRTELQEFTAKAKGVTDLQNRIKEFEAKHKVIENINKKKSGPVRIMENLSAATPRALWLTQFKETSGDLTITGVAMDNQTIAEFLKALASYANFRDTELVETAQTEQTGLPPRRFLIKSRLLYQPPAAATKPNAVEPAVPTKAN
jgi:type IV pilus assembly protein PilN